MRVLERQPTASGLGFGEMMNAAQSPVDITSPHYSVRVEVSPGDWLDLTPRVTSYRHNPRVSKAPRIEITLDNRDLWPMQQEVLLRDGARFDTLYGYPGKVHRPGIYVAKEHEPTDQSLSITCHEPKRTRASRHDRSRVWLDATRSEAVLAALVADGLNPSELDITHTGERLESITQAQESGWVFAVEMAALEGFDLWVDGGKVFWGPSPRSKAPSSRIRQVRGFYGAGVIKPGWKLSKFKAGVPSRVTLSGIDANTGKAWSVEASEAATELDSVERTDDFQTPEEGDASGGVVGFEIRDTCGARTAAEGKRLADAIYREYRYKATTLTVPMFGDPAAQPQRNTIFWGIAPQVDGIYQIREADHKLGTNGFDTDVVIKRGGRRRAETPDTKLEQALDNLERQESHYKPIEKLKP